VSSRATRPAHPEGIGNGNSIELDLHAKRQRALSAMFSEVGIVNSLELELLDWGDSHARVRMPYTDCADNRSGTPLGGAIATLADMAGAAAVWAGHDFANGTKHATVSLTLNFMGAPGKTPIVAEARCARRARELNFVNIEVATEDGSRKIASALMTFRVVSPQR